MAAEILNDLAAPVEAKDEIGEWKVIYPTKSLILPGRALTLRLREEPTLLGICECEKHGVLKASEDFGQLSLRGKQMDAEERRATEREKVRREEAFQRQQEQIAREARRIRNRFAMFWIAFLVPAWGLLPIFMFLVALGLSLRLEINGRALEPAGAVIVVFPCVLLGYCVGRWGTKTARSDTNFGDYACCASASFNCEGILGFAALAFMTWQLGVEFWRTSLILWVVAGGGLGWWTYNCRRGAFGQVELDRPDLVEVFAQHDRARDQVKNRTIRFEGRVIPERGRPCVASWPGKYEGAWEALVRHTRAGEVSAAVVFLPDGTEDYGCHDPIQTAEGLSYDPDACWCIPLYGEPKPWGCRWWTRWLRNVEMAVESGAELEVYFFAGLAGRGKVQSFDSAGREHLRREEIYGKLREFKESPQFKAASAQGLDGLSRERREDSSSRYSRELHRLFLDWLPKEEAESLEASEGLGNSQKAEVAWLDRKGYQYREVDVSMCLSDEDAAVEVQEPHGAVDDVSTPRMPIPHEVPADIQSFQSLDP